MRTDPDRTSNTRHIRRDSGGAIDIAFYTKRAEALRARWLRRWLRTLIARGAGWWARQVARKELSALDERSLKDIGITRTDIPAIISGAFLKDPSRIGRSVGECVPKFGSVDPLRFARSWIDAWNRHDLDAVLSHFSDDFEFSSPIIREFVGEPSGQLVGKQAMRRYWAAALDSLPDTYIELESVLFGVNCLTIVYSGEPGRRAEVFQFGSDGRAIRGFEQYPA
jgi:uncharacterized protein YjiS (DUF1127 family)